MSGEASGDPAAQVDELVAVIGPRLDSPAISRRDVVLVTGPWMAGATSVATALGERLPEHKFVESADLQPGEAPKAVVFVVSAAAELTASDCALLDAACEHTDVVVAVVSKIDVHRAWREVLSANRDVLAAHAPRYAQVPWIGAAAAPELGEPQLDELVDTVSEQLADSHAERRNRLRAWESRLRTVAQRFDRDADSRPAGLVEALREQRSAALRERREAKSERSIAMRGQTQQARVQLSHLAVNRCSSVRSELQSDAAHLPRRDMAGFEAHARGRSAEVVNEVNEDTTTRLDEVARELELPLELPPVEQLPTVDVAAPPLKSRRQETWLMLLLGVGFGVGVALTLSRLVAGVAHRLNPALEIAAAVVCVAIGLAVTVLVVKLRALLDRWTGDLVSSLRSVTEELVATRVLAAETLLSSGLVARDEAENARVSEQVSAIDTELREHAIAAARATAARDREMPAVAAALVAVRAELGEPGIPHPDSPAGETGGVDHTQSASGSADEDNS